MRTLLAIILLCGLSATAKTYTVTAYCPCAECCGRWSGGATASGRMPQAGITVAASRRIPLGTWLNIAGLGKRRVDDRLARRYDGRIDVFFPTHAQAAAFGKRRVAVSITKKYARP